MSVNNTYEINITILIFVSLKCKHYKYSHLKLDNPESSTQMKSKENNWITASELTRGI